MSIEKKHTPQAEFDPDFGGGGGGGGEGNNKETHETIRTVSKHQLIYSLSGLFVGVICIISGLVIFLHGIVGNISWTAKFIGSESSISDAGPGAIIFIVGLFVILATRYVMKVKK